MRIHTRPLPMQIHAATRPLLFAILLVPSLAVAPHSLPARDARNPIIHADVPDVAVIRAGDTYYMSSTTMHLSPGLPIMKSKDLVNWELVSYAYATLDDGGNDALALRNGQNAYGRGSWASSLRFHNGVCYVTTFSSNTNRTHIYATRDIEHGPWTATSFAPKLHDHTLHFEDDGRVYMIHGAGDLRIIEINPDLSGVKPGGLDRVIIPDASAVAGPDTGLPAEGSQLRKINGKYYLFAITWPKGGMRTQLVFRSDTLTGPYEGRVFLADQGVAQGCLIDTPDGDWYAMLFQDNGAVGRTPFLIPLAWRDGWPVASNDGKAPPTLPIPADDNPVSGIVTSDEFTHDSNAPAPNSLLLAWQWNHNPVNTHWSLTARPGWLRLTTSHVTPDFLAARNTLTQRTFGPRSSATTLIDTASMRDGDIAGLAALQKNYGYIAIKAGDGAKALIMVSAETGAPETTAVLPLPPAQKTLRLKLDCDFLNRADTARFHYSLDGETWRPLGPPLKMSYTLPHFMGYRFALFNYATKAPGGSADFDYFRLSDKITASAD